MDDPPAVACSCVQRQGDAFLIFFSHPQVDKLMPVKSQEDMINVFKKVDGWCFEMLVIQKHYSHQWPERAR